MRDADATEFAAGFFTFPFGRGRQNQSLSMRSIPFLPDAPRVMCAAVLRQMLACRDVCATPLRRCCGRPNAPIMSPPGRGKVMTAHWKGVGSRKGFGSRQGYGLPGCAAFVALVGAAVAASLALAAPARAEGALAVGIARGGAAKGYATGFAINQPTVKAARSSAVEQCKKTKSSNADAKSGCEVVVTFHNKCVAAAFDPESGTPGAGWGIGPSQQSADEQALARCRAKAGSDRAEFCKVTDQ
jgi:hypothetical protein